MSSQIIDVNGLKMTILIGFTSLIDKKYKFVLKMKI